MRGITFLIFFLHAMAVSGQKITASPNAQSILIGEPFSLKLQANFDKSETVEWFEIDTVPHFEILERSRIDTLRLEGSLALTQTLNITSWDSGRWEVPSFTLGKFRTEPFTVVVNFSQPFDPTQPYHDLKDIIEVKKPATSNWQWYLIFALVLIALFLLFFPAAKKRPPNEFIADTNIFKQSLKQLELLRARHGDDPKSFHTELIAIFRDYLLRRKNIESFAKTSDDLGMKVEPFFSDHDQFTPLMQTLRLSDLVKFAKLAPLPNENQQAVDRIAESIIIIENSSHAV